MSEAQFDLGLPEIADIRDPDTYVEYQRIISTLHRISNQMFPKDAVSQADYESLGVAKVDFHRYSTFFVRAGSRIESRRAVGFYPDGTGGVLAGHSNFTLKRWPVGLSLGAANEGELVAICLYGLIGGFSDLIPFMSYGTRGDEGLFAPHTNDSLTAGTHINLGYAITPNHFFFGGTMSSYFDAVQM